MEDYDLFDDLLNKTPVKIIAGNFILFVIAVFGGMLVYGNQKCPVWFNVWGVITTVSVFILLIIIILKIIKNS